MSNKETLQGYNETLSQYNTNLDDILNTINNLPENENLTEELDTYNSEVTEQEATIDTILKTLQSKAIGGGGSMNNYSTEETVIGTWIDGKTLYRKVILIGTVSTTETDTPVNIPNLDTIKKIEGGGYMSNGHFLPWNFENAGGFVSCYYSIQKSTIRTIASAVSYEIHNCFAIIEYTKTTD